MVYGISVKMWESINVDCPATHAWDSTFRYKDVISINEKIDSVFFNIHSPNKITF